MLAFLLLVIGGAVVLVSWLARRSRQIGARDGLYPRMDHGRGRYADLNEPGAQSLAVLAAGRRPTAALAGRVIDAQYRTGPEPAALPEPESPAALAFPQRAPIYHAALPRDLALPVGIDGAGRPVALPLRNLGNVLVAGLPGSGKSELLASMLAGLLRQDSTGQRLQVATVDSKLVTFGNLPPLAALYAPPALEIEDAHALVWGLVEEVRRRFQLLQAANVRSIEEYQSKTGQALPYLVTVIDELADMTADHDRKRAALFSAAAMEIGRKGRAAGVALVMATQRPSVDVIPSSLRNLAGAAVCFRVQRNHDSIAVLGDPARSCCQLPPAGAW
ncbi:MAG: FtsK/SpoIIIE domain-containing protein [Anaerolineae bacterium]